MRILVTGGAGFIGSNVADRLLADGHEVSILDDLSTGKRANLPARARFFEADLLDADAVSRCLAAARPEIVSHHAAQIDVRHSVEDPVGDAKINILGALHLFLACTAHRVRKVVYASTGGALYGEGIDLPATEEHPLRPESPYGASKLAVERYLALWKGLHGLDYTVLRYPNVYGPRQDPHGEAGVNAIFIGLMLHGERPRIFGSGDQTRDYLYVDDVVDANIRALESGSGATLNLGTGIGTSVNDIFRELQAILGFRGEPRREPPRAGEIQHITLDAARARQVLGWTPRTAFRDGLARTVEWSRAAGV